MNNLYYDAGSPFLGFAASLDSSGMDSSRAVSRWNHSDSDSLDSHSFVEVPPSVSQTFEFRLASEHMDIARFGNGADVVAKGFGMLWYNYGMLSASQAFEFSSAYERALENFGVLEFSRSLLNIRTTSQDDFLRSLVNRALQSIPFS